MPPGIVSVLVVQDIFKVNVTKNVENKKKLAIFKTREKLKSVRDNKIKERDEGKYGR